MITNKATARREYHEQNRFVLVWTAHVTQLQVYGTVPSTGFLLAKEYQVYIKYILVQLRETASLF
jgi:cytidylate kinase